ncbi:YitT family protein [Oceanidesulfovibrio indonesiensis]|nr:YitT family protein [Oceanidesulfovibrio indonesiensis]
MPMRFTRRTRERVHRKLTLPTRARLRRVLFQQSLIFFGATIAALGYALFQVPFNLAAGGVSGLALIINKYTGIPPGSLFLILNIPLLALGFSKLGRWRFLFSTILAVVVFSVMADVFGSVLPDVLKRYPVTDDALLSAIYAGILYGVGMGLVFRHGGTVGGTSVPARILHNATGFPMSQAYLYTDLSVIIAAGFVFSWESALLAFLTLVLSGIVSDFTLEGTSQVRTAMIITDQPEPLTYALMTELRRGVSYWNITGAYTQSSHTMIYCTVLRSRVYDLKYVVAKIDPQAFMVIGVAQQAFGGLNFRKLKQEE